MVQKMPGPKNLARTHFNLARTQYELRADSVNKTKNAFGTNARIRATEVARQFEMKWTISIVTLTHNYSSLLFVYV